MIKETNDSHSRLPAEKKRPLLARNAKAGKEGKNSVTIHFNNGPRQRIFVLM